MINYREKAALQAQIAAIADRLLVKLNLTTPFSLKDLCRGVAQEYGTGFYTYRAQMPSEIGGIGMAARNGRTIILVNERHSYLTEDYTILHEIGHLILGHLEPGHAAYERDETQADLFAQLVLDRMVLPKRHSSSQAARLKRFLS